MRLLAIATTAVASHTVTNVVAGTNAVAAVAAAANAAAAAVPAAAAAAETAAARGIVGGIAATGAVIAACQALFGHLNLKLFLLLGQFGQLPGRIAGAHDGEVGNLWSNVTKDGFAKMGTLI